MATPTLALDDDFGDIASRVDDFKADDEGLDSSDEGDAGNFDDLIISVAELLIMVLMAAALRDRWMGRDRPLLRGQH